MLSGDSSLSEKVKHFAKEGAKTGAVAGILTLVSITVLSYGADELQTVKDLGIPGYAAIFASVEAYVISGTLLFEVSAHYGGKAKDKLVEYIHNR